MQVIKDFQYFFYERPFIKEALTLAIVAVTSLLVAQALKLPQGYWAVMSSMIVMQSDVKATLSASWSRLAGTAIGALIGGIFIALLGNHPWSFGGAVVMVVLVCLSMGLKDSYRFAAVTVGVIMLTKQTESPWIIAFFRFLEVSLGIIIAICVFLMLNPSVFYLRVKNKFKE